ncbi:hypothetical protein EBZ35_05775 [bacterium]|nr:hypothetical protein [bacterium]
MRKWGLLVIGMGVASVLNAASGAAAFMDNSGQAQLAGRGGYAVAQGIDGLSGNPAGLVSTDGFRFAGTAYQYLETDYAEVQVGWMWEGIGLGASMLNSQVASSKTSQTGVDNRLVDTGEGVGYVGRGIVAGVGYQISRRLSVGVNGKWIQEVAAGYTGSGWGADLGGLWGITNEWDLGVVYKNIVQPQMGWDTPSKTVEAVGQELQVGTQYRFLGGKLTTLAEVGIKSNESIVRLGGQYWVTEQLPIWGSVTSRGWNLGTGLRLGEAGIDFSYMQPSTEGLDPSYRFGLNLGWR